MDLFGEFEPVNPPKCAHGCMIALIINYSCSLYWCDC